MDKRIRGFFIILVAAVLVGCAILIHQISRARDISTRAETRPLISSVAIDIPSFTTDPSYGNPGADVHITEFIDMANPTSRAFHIMLYKFASENPRKVRLVWKDFPQKHVFSGDSTAAHIAAHCADKQNAFWEYTNKLFAIKSNLGHSDLTATAKAIGLNMTSWQACIESSSAQQEVAHNAAIAPTIGITAAPAIFINNKLLNTSLDINYDQLLTLLISP